MFKSMKSEPNGDGKKSKTKFEVVPYDGLYNNNRRVEKFVTLAELNKQEGIMNMNMNTDMAMKDDKEVKKEESQFWLFDKYANKVDLLFMTKVLLKIIVFKKIVKFIALICLLFFLPTINDNSEEEKKDSRNFDVYGKILIVISSKLEVSNFNFPDQIDYRTREILYFAIVALEGFTVDKMVWCVAEHDAFCRFQTMFDNIDQIYTVDQ